MNEILKTAKIEGNKVEEINKLLKKVVSDEKESDDAHANAIVK